MPVTLATTTAAGARLAASLPPLAPGPVLIAADGDELASVLRAGAQLIEHLGRDAIVLSALDPLREYGWHPSAGPYAASTTRALIERRREQLRRELVMAGGSSRWPIAVELGGAPQALARVARETNASVLIMGLGPVQPVDRLLGAETVLRTLRHASCPILAVPRSGGGLATVAVVGVDFSPNSAHALRAVLPFLQPNAVVHLVHVCRSTELADWRDVARDERYRAQLPERFRRLVLHAGLPDHVQLRHEVREGRPAEQLLGAAEAVHADLVVVGRHGDGWLDRLIVGRVAERVLRGARSAVLVVPEAAPAERGPAMLEGTPGQAQPREAWAALLERFTRDNAGRLTVLESCDREEGPSAREAGYVLFGITYREREHEVEIILGEANGRRRHMTRVIPDARALVTFADAQGDRGVRIEHGRGQSVLSLMP